MDNLSYWVLILGMALVTYLPRAVPAALVGRLHFPPKVRKFLKLIPYTAMASLICPAIFTVDAERPWIGLCGALTAGVLAWKKCPVILCVLAAIAVNFVIYLVI